MEYATEHISASLNAARQEKGISQRALSKLTGVPQSHISKIESGAVDLRLSSLIEIARALDLEVTLVPRKNVAAVQTIVRSSVPVPTAPNLYPAAKELNRIQKSLKAANQKHPTVKEIAQLQRKVRELQRLKLDTPELETLRKANEAVQNFKNGTAGLDAMRKTLVDIQSLRNTIVHSLPKSGTAKPAYSLDEDDHG